MESRVYNSWSWIRGFFNSSHSNDTQAMEHSGTLQINKNITFREQFKAISNGLMSYIWPHSNDTLSSPNVGDKGSQDNLQGQYSRNETEFIKETSNYVMSSIGRVLGWPTLGELWNQQSPLAKLGIAGAGIAGIATLLVWQGNRYYERKKAADAANAAAAADARAEQIKKDIESVLEGNFSGKLTEEHVKALTGEQKKQIAQNWNLLNHLAEKIVDSGIANNESTIQLLQEIGDEIVNRVVIWRFLKDPCYVSDLTENNVKSIYFFDAEKMTQNHIENLMVLLFRKLNPYALKQLLSRVDLDIPRDKFFSIDFEKLPSLEELNVKIADQYIQRFTTDQIEYLLRDTKGLLSKEKFQQIPEDKIKDLIPRMVANSIYVYVNRVFLTNEMQEELVGQAITSEALKSQNEQDMYISNLINMLKKEEDNEKKKKQIDEIDTYNQYIRDPMREEFVKYAAKVEDWKPKSQEDLQALLRVMNKEKDDEDKKKQLDKIGIILDYAFLEGLRPEYANTLADLLPENQHIINYKMRKSAISEFLVNAKIEDDILKYIDPEDVEVFQRNQVNELLKHTKNNDKNYKLSLINPEAIKKLFSDRMKKDVVEDYGKLVSALSDKQIDALDISPGSWIGTNLDEDIVNAIMLRKPKCPQQE